MHERVTYVAPPYTCFMFLPQAFGIQTVSGCGALRIGAELLVRHARYDTFYISAPTWGKFSSITNSMQQNPSAEVASQRAHPVHYPELSESN
jgi:hypothetical protein